MNTLMMFARAGGECCQPPSPRLPRSRCENVAITNTDYQFAYAKATADQLEIGNIGIGNTSTMATLNKMFARIVAGRFLDRINKINMILAWRTGDTEDGVLAWRTGEAGGRLRLPPDPAEGGPKLSCISCSTCLKNNPVNPVNPV